MTDLQTIDANAKLLSAGYGAGSGWQVALINPSNEIVSISGLGYFSSTTTELLVFAEIQDLLLSDECTWADSKLVGSAVSQMLGLSDLQRWHHYRLAWGSAEPCEKSGYPNGIDTCWTLYFVANGRNSVVVQGTLPEGWWEMDDDDQQHYLQGYLQDLS